MKIVLIGTTSESFIRFRKSLIQTLVERGHTVFVLCNDFSPSTTQEVLALKANPVSYNINRSGLNPFKDIKHTYQLYKILASLKCDIVFSFFAKPSIYGTLAAKMAGVKNIYAMLEGLGTTFTIYPNYRLKHTFIKFVQLCLYRISFRFLDVLFVLNPDDKIELVEKHRLPIKYCEVLGGIGVNFEEYEFSEAPDEPISFLFIGRLLREKGVLEFVQAANTVKQKFPYTIFYIVGGQDTENPSGLSVNQLEELKQNPNIEYIGHVSNIIEWINKSSVFVLPSYREGIPRSTQEAMAIGRAVITTNVPGCKETVVDGVNGFLVPAFSETALAAKMIFFIENTEFIKKMGYESHLIASRLFDENKVNQKILQLLNVNK